MQIRPQSLPAQPAAAPQTPPAAQGAVALSTSPPIPPASAQEPAPALTLDIKDILQLQGDEAKPSPQLLSLAADRVLDKIGEVKRLDGKVILKIGEQRVLLDPAKLKKAHLLAVLQESFARLPAAPDMAWARSLRAEALRVGHFALGDVAHLGKQEVRALEQSNAQRESARHKAFDAAADDSAAATTDYMAARDKALKLKDPAARQQALSQAEATFRQRIETCFTRLRADFAKVQADYRQALSTPGGATADKLTAASQTSLDLICEHLRSHVAQTLEIQVKGSAELAACLGQPAKARHQVEQQITQSLAAIRKDYQQTQEAAHAAFDDTETALLKPEVFLKQTDETRETARSKAFEQTQTALTAADETYIAARDKALALADPAARQSALSQAETAYRARVETLFASFHALNAAVQAAYSERLAHLGGPAAEKLIAASQASLAQIEGNYKSHVGDLITARATGASAIDQARDLPPKARRQAVASAEKALEQAKQAIVKSYLAGQKVAHNTFDRIESLSEDARELVSKAGAKRESARHKAFEAASVGLADAMGAYDKAERAALRLADPAARRQALDQAAEVFARQRDKLFSTYQARIGEIQAGFANTLRELGGPAAEQLIEASQTSLDERFGHLRSHFDAMLTVLLQGSAELEQSQSLPGPQRKQAQAATAARTQAGVAEVRAHYDQSFDPNQDPYEKILETLTAK